MTAKQYLRQGYRLRELIQTHKDELAQLHRMVGSVQSPGFNKPGGGTPKWNGETAEQSLVIKTVDLENQIKQEIGSMIDLLHGVHDTIETVTNRDERLVLRCRYILFLSWSETAGRMNYSYQQVRRIHGTALQHITVPEQYRDAEPDLTPKVEQKCSTLSKSEQT